MMNHDTEKIEKTEYQTPVLIEYGNIASITQLGGGPHSDGDLNNPISMG